MKKISSNILKMAVVAIALTATPAVYGMDKNLEAPVGGPVDLTYAAEKALPAVVHIKYVQNSKITTVEVEDPFSDFFSDPLLFSDGAAGILVVPDSLRARFSLPLMEVEALQTDFVAGGSLAMHGGKLVLEDNLKDAVVPIVRDKIIRPLGVTSGNIQEWSLHQGGMPILMRFTEPGILGLSEEQIGPSKTVFQRYGNFSAPSVVFVLEQWFKDKNRAEKDEKTRGCAISFGAGYFVAGMTYHWSKR